MINGRAVGFLIIAIFLFLLAGATNVGWVRIVDAVLWGMLLLSLVLQWLSVTALEVRRRVGHIEHSGKFPSPMEDDTVEVELELRNLRFWPRFFLSLSYDASVERPDDRWQRFFSANLIGHGSVRLSSRLRCYRRGLHRFGRVTIESQVPFGLFRRRRHKEAPLSLLVYPKAYPMKQVALVEGLWGMSALPQKSRSGVEVVGSRPYAPGDQLRHINWRSTARLRRLVVKEMEDISERALTIVFDTRLDVGRGRETTLEYSVKLAASIGLHALSSGQSVRMVAGITRGEWSDPQGFLRELALVEAGDSPGLTALLQTASRSPVLLILAAADAQGVGSVEQGASSRSGLAAVVLEGFEPAVEVPGVADRLGRAGVPTVVCRQGALGDAIGALERAGRPSSPGVWRPEDQSPAPGSNGAGQEPTERVQAQQ